MKNISIVAIHGTFAQRADWISRDSAMHVHLSRVLQEKFSTSWFDFRWSGGNTSRSRELAAAGLAIEVENIRTKNPETEVFLIGHSHGGNVAILAANTLLERGHEISGVVALSTPFIKVERLDYAYQKEIAQLGEIVLKNPLAYLVVFGVGLLLVANYTLSLAWAAMAFVYVGFFLAWATSLDAINFVSKCSPESFKLRQDRIVKNYEPSKDFPPIFSIRTRMDEALLVLNAIVGSVRLLTNIFDVAKHGWAVLLFWLVLSAFVLGGNLLWLIFLPGLHAAIYFISNSIRSREFSFGEDIKDQAVVEFLVDAQPSPVKHYWHRVVSSGVGIPILGGLRHSSLYKSEHVFDLVSEFVLKMSRSASNRG